VSSSWSFLLRIHTSRDRNRATYLPHYILLSRKPESLFFNITLSSSFMPFVMSHLFSSLLVICLLPLDLSHSLLIYITLFLSLGSLLSHFLLIYHYISLGYLLSILSLPLDYLSSLYIYICVSVYSKVAIQNKAFPFNPRRISQSSISPRPACQSLG